MVVMLVLAGHARRGEAPAGRTVQQASAQLPCMRCPVPESTMNTSSDRPAQQASKQPTQATNTQTHTHPHSTTPAGGSAPWCEQDRLQNYEAQQARADARAAARAEIGESEAEVAASLAELEAAQVSLEALERGDGSEEAIAAAREEVEVLKQRSELRQKEHALQDLGDSGASKAEVAAARAEVESLLDNGWSGRDSCFFGALCDVNPLLFDAHYNQHDR